MCNNVSDDQIITVSLYKKTLPGNLDFGYTLLNYQNFVSNSEYEVFDGNVYKLITHPYIDMVRTTYNDRFQINFNDRLEKGLYRLYFDVRSGPYMSTDFATFIVD